MAYSVGPIDFSWLGNLPDVYRSSKIQSLEEALPQADLTNPDAMSRRAAELMKIGAFDEANKLVQAANTLRGINEQAAFHRMWVQSANNPPVPISAPNTGPIPPPPITDPGNPNRGLVPTAPVPYVNSSEAQPPTPTAFADLRSAQPPMDLPPQLGAPERTRLAALDTGTISDAPAIGTPPPQQMAQAAPQFTAPGLPAMTGGVPGISTGPTAPNVRAPATAPAPAAARPAVNLPLDDSQQTIMNNIESIGRAMSRAGPYNTGQQNYYKAALDAQFKLLNAANNPNINEYVLAQRQKVANGELPESFQAYTDNRNLVTQHYGSVDKLYNDEYFKPKKAALEITRSSNALEILSRNENWMSGPGTQGFAHTSNAINSLIQMGRNLGAISEDQAGKFQDSIRGATSTATLQGLATAVANQAVTGLLGGSLGRSISDADREFMGRIAPSLAMTPQGFAALARYLPLVAERALKAEGTARQYWDEAKTNATVPGMINAVEKYTDNPENRIFIKGRNPDGSPILTDAGKEWQKIVNEAAPAGQRGEQPGMLRQFSDTVNEVGNKLLNQGLGGRPPTASEMALAPFQAASAGAKALGVPIPENYDPTALPREIAGAAGAAPNIAAGVVAGAQAVPGALRNEYNRLVNPQAPITAIGRGPSDAFNPQTWAQSYSDLSAKDKVVQFGPARLDYNDISKGMPGLSKVLSPQQIEKGLADPAAAASMAAWARGYELVKRTGSTAAIARLHMLNQNLKNTLGGL